MITRKASPIFRRRSRGLGLVELLISLALCAALLTATGVAVDASLRSYSIQQQQASTVQKARLIMHRIQTYIRSSKEHQPATPAVLDSFAQGLVCTDTSIVMYTSDNQLLAFRHDVTNQRLILSHNNTDRILAEGVEQFRVTFEPMRSPTAIRTGGPYDLLLRATIVLTIRNTASGGLSDVNESRDATPVTLSISVMPRRNIW
jgi:Tfp pilus assembly protein PilE